MKPEIKEFLISLLEDNRGDALYRAKHMFKNYTEYEMNQEYGFSGLTRNEILKSYQDHEDKINEAIKAVEAL